MNYTRCDVITRARGWIGTPYRHQASLIGIGADCLGLVRGVWRELEGRDAEAPPAYTRDWAEASGRETLLEAARRHLVARPLAARRPGDVLVFRFRAGTAAKHVGIQVSPTTFVHAIEGAQASEVALCPWWQRRIAGVFCFPGVVSETSAASM